MHTNGCNALTMYAAPRGSCGGFRSPLHAVQLTDPGSVCNSEKLLTVRYALPNLTDDEMIDSDIVGNVNGMDVVEGVRFVDAYHVVDDNGSDMPNAGLEPYEATVASGALA